MSHPTDLPHIYREAADQLDTVGYYPDDIVVDPFDHRLRTPHRLRPMNLEGAVRCVISGDPHAETDLADRALLYAARHLVVDGETVYDDRPSTVAWHLHDWCQTNDARYVIRMLRTLADLADLDTTPGQVAA